MSDEPSQFDEVFNFLDDDAIRTPPIPSTKHPEGRVYVIPSPDAETGLRLAALAEIGRKLNAGLAVDERDMRRLNMDDDEEREFAVQVLGSSYDEMLADGVSWVRLQKMTQFAYVWFAFGQEVAEKSAREGLFTGGKVTGELLNRAARRAKGKKAKGTGTGK